MYDFAEKISKHLYTGYSICHESLWQIILMLLCYALLLDIAICPAFQRSQAYIINASGFISALMNMVVVSWTFNVAIAVAYFGKLEYQCYGVRLVDIILMKSSFLSLFRISIMLIIELFLLIPVVLGNLLLTMIMIAGSQIYNMIYFGLIVWHNTRNRYVLEYIHNDLIEFNISILKWKEKEEEKRKKEKEKKKEDKKNHEDEKNNEINNEPNYEEMISHLLLIKMIRRLDYQDTDEIDCLSEMAANNFHEVNDEIGQLFGRKITTTLLDCSHAETGQKLEIINAWASKASLMVKKGIIDALLIEPNPEYLNVCEDIICRDNNTKKELLLHFIVENCAYLRYKNEDWRDSLNAYTIEQTSMIWTEESRDTLLALWYKRLGNDAQNNLYRIFRIIY